MSDKSVLRIDDLSVSTKFYKKCQFLVNKDNDLLIKEENAREWRKLGRIQQIQNGCDLVAFSLDDMWYVFDENKVSKESDKYQEKAIGPHHARAYANYLGGTRFMFPSLDIFLGQVAVALGLKSTTEPSITFEGNFKLNLFLLNY